jgi:RNA polymerase sigma factor (sigma-70 family)
VRALAHAIDQAGLRPTLLETLRPTPWEDRLAFDFRKAVLESMLESLPERDRRVLELRFGLRGEEPHTLEHIGRRLGISRERVRQIEMAALQRLTLRELDKVPEPENEAS